MKHHWRGRIFKGAILVVVLLAVLSWAVMSLWNWLFPTLFTWPHISFVQAMGLLVLSRILFGSRPGFGGGPWGRHWREKMHARWEQMTPEEREKLRAGLRGRCGPWGAGAPWHQESQPSRDPAPRQD